MKAINVFSLVTLLCLVLAGCDNASIDTNNITSTNIYTNANTAINTNTKPKSPLYDNENGPSESQIHSAIKTHFNEWDKSDRKLNNQSGQLVFESVEKVGYCEPSQAEATKLRCPVKINVSQKGRFNSESTQHEVSQKMYIWQEDGNWVVDFRLRGQIRAAIIFGGVGFEVKHLEDVE
ncbi:hypothetical protein [Xenorhabdus innexi]|uniref:Lipoprotein n=1 Tax=Xenorhabdus innexi TaxID=290109 RepID=A0A1N6MSU6_9GAMM|nr:hypothetical protein [Xenorhabdus innexi]PHM30164.1 hypothetical protein Xinn_03490 [Xenorhabdus innexi]SIP71906.1 exported hypothetical protein [Xenorhabdus innexi]